MNYRSDYCNYYNNNNNSNNNNGNNNNNNNRNNNYYNYYYFIIIIIIDCIQCPNSWIFLYLYTLVETVLDTIKCLKNIKSLFSNSIKNSTECGRNMFELLQKLANLFNKCLNPNNYLFSQSFRVDI